MERFRNQNQTRFVPVEGLGGTKTELVLKASSNTLVHIEVLNDLEANIKRFLRCEISIRKFGTP